MKCIAHIGKESKLHWYSLQIARKQRIELTEMTSSRVKTWEPQTKALLVSLASMESRCEVSVEFCESVALMVFLLSKTSFPEMTSYPSKSDCSSPISILCSSLFEFLESLLLALTSLRFETFPFVRFSGKTTGEVCWPVDIWEQKLRRRSDCWGVFKELLLGRLPLFCMPFTVRKELNVKDSGNPNFTLAVKEMGDRSDSYIYNPRKTCWMLIYMINICMEASIVWESIRILSLCKSINRKTF